MAVVVVAGKAGREEEEGRGAGGVSGAGVEGVKKAGVEAAGVEAARVEVLVFLSVDVVDRSYL